MPFMLGKSPVRRTLKYLNKCKIIFRDNVKIFSVNYNTNNIHHKGAMDFVFWHLDQIQYKNPNVHCLTIKNMTPSPFIRIFLEDAKSVLIDLDSREKDDILKHLENFTAICKEPSESEEKKLVDDESVFAYFGHGCERHCICEVFGQIPCPSIVKLPTIWRGIPEKNPKYCVPPHFMEPGLEE